MGKSFRKSIAETDKWDKKKFNRYARQTLKRKLRDYKVTVTVNPSVENQNG